jgi:hypothetical protein
MTVFSDAEISVVETLLRPLRPADWIRDLLDTAEEVSYDFTGQGYFFTVRHPGLLDAPLSPEGNVFIESVFGVLASETEGGLATLLGFNLFHTEDELTVECYCYPPAEGVPSDIRQRQVVFEGQPGFDAPTSDPPTVKRPWWRFW